MCVVQEKHRRRNKIYRGREEGGIQTDGETTQKNLIAATTASDENVMSLFIDRLFLCTVLKTHEHIFSAQQGRRKAADVHFCSKTTLIYASQPTGIM